MADYESALSALSDAFGSDHSGLAGRLSEILGDAIQALIEDELTARIGAEPNQRTTSRSAQRNGHRPKLISTPGGDV